jgi:cold shock CspA family protein
MIVRGKVVRLDREYGVGGVGYIVDGNGVVYFFHSRKVRPPGYSKLEVGSPVEFEGIGARGAMGASARATDVRQLLSGKPSAKLIDRKPIRRKRKNKG